MVLVKLIGHIRLHGEQERVYCKLCVRRMTRRQPSSISLQRVLLATKMRLHIMNSHVAMIDYHNHALSNIHGLYGWNCNLLDIISIFSLNPGKLPGRFSYEWPGCEASMVLCFRNFPRLRAVRAWSSLNVHVLY